MDIHKPKPIHGWREFLKEYGIIVLGVLTALGGEQVVERLHHRSEVREAREALSEEVAWNMAALRGRDAVGPCIATRLDELDRWVVASRSGRPLMLNRRIGGAGIIPFRRSVWKVVTASVVVHMPLADRISYAKFYDLIDAVEDRLGRASGLWADLGQIQAAGRLDPAKDAQVKADIDQLRGINRDLSRNVPTIVREARAAGIAPPDLPVDPDALTSRRAFCATILADEPDR